MARWPSFCPAGFPLLPSGRGSEGEGRDRQVTSNKKSRTVLGQAPRRRGQATVGTQTGGVKFESPFFCRISLDGAGCSLLVQIAH